MSTFFGPFGMWALAATRPLRTVSSVQLESCGCKLGLLPSNQTWPAEKSWNYIHSINGGVNGKLIYKWWMFNCHVSLPEGNRPTWKKHRTQIIAIKVVDDPLPRLITRGKWVKTMAIAHICLDIYPNGYNMLQHVETMAIYSIVLCPCIPIAYKNIRTQI